MLDIPTPPASLADIVDWDARRFDKVLLRRAMVTRGYDTKSLAKATGLGESTIQKARSGLHPVGESTINRVLEALNRRRPLEGVA